MASPRSWQPWWTSMRTTLTASSTMPAWMTTNTLWFERSDNDAAIIVVTDANVLIDLMHVARLDLCSRLPGHEFVVPDHVREEIIDANQRMALDDAVCYTAASASGTARLASEGWRMS